MIIHARLALLGVASLFVCCMIHCKHLRLSDANKLSYLLTFLLTYVFVSQYFEPDLAPSNKIFLVVAILPCSDSERDFSGI